MSQLDMFSHQLDLLAPLPAPTVEPAPPTPAPRRTGGMPCSVIDKWERAGTDEVVEAIFEVAKGRPGEWLTSSDFEAVIQRFDISSQRVRPLLKLVLAGRLDQHQHYFGANKPGPDYRGFRYEWRYAPKESPHA